MKEKLFYNSKKFFGFLICLQTLECVNPFIINNLLNFLDQNFNLFWMLIFFNFYKGTVNLFKIDHLQSLHYYFYDKLN